MSAPCPTTDEGREAPLRGPLWRVLAALRSSGAPLEHAIHVAVAFVFTAIHMVDLPDPFVVMAEAVARVRPANAFHVAPPAGGPKVALWVHRSPAASMGLLSALWAHFTNDAMDRGVLYPLSLGRVIEAFPWVFLCHDAFVWTTAERRGALRGGGAPELLDGPFLSLAADAALWDHVRATLARLGPAARLEAAPHPRPSLSRRLQLELHFARGLRMEAPRLVDAHAVVIMCGSDALDGWSARALADVRAGVLAPFCVVGAQRGARGDRGCILTLAVVRTGPDARRSMPTHARVEGGGGTTRGRERGAPVPTAGMLSFVVAHLEDGVGPTTAALLHAPHIVKVGCGRAWTALVRPPIVPTWDIVERATSARIHALGTRGSVPGVQQLAAYYLSVWWERPVAVARSDWREWPLSEAQHSYVVTDAAVVARVYEAQRCR